jgi:signal transduction histidine kinase
VPIFELLVLGLMGLILAFAFRLYEAQQDTDPRVEFLRRLKREFLALKDFTAATVARDQSSVSNYLAHPSKDMASVIRTNMLASDLWLTNTLAVANELVDEAPTQALAAASLNIRVATNYSLAHLDLINLIEETRSAHRSYSNAVEYILKNAGSPLIKDRLDNYQRMELQQSQRLINYSRQAGVRALAIDQLMPDPQDTFYSIERKLRNLQYLQLLVCVAAGFLLITLLYRWRLAQSNRIMLAHAGQQAHMDKLAHFSRLAQELAHEIKQPLTAINARLYTLQKSLATDGAPARDAAVIRSEIKRLDQVVKDFLMLARPSEPVLASINASQTLREVHDLMSTQLAEQSIAFQFECKEDLPMMADAYQLKQVLINLIKNAVESLGNDGRIILRGRADTLAINENCPPEHVAVIEVEDNGPGIPPELQTKIFDPFFSTKKDGTGLGLAIAARMIDKHAGRLKFSSNPGEGTVFQILLPSTIRAVTA